MGPLSESELPCASGVRAVRRRLVRLRHGVLSAHGATSSRNDAGVGRPARRGTVPSTQWAVRAPTEGEEAASWTRSSSKGSEGPPCSDVPACSLGAIRAARRREVCSEPRRQGTRCNQRAPVCMPVHKARKLTRCMRNRAASTARGAVGSGRSLDGRARCGCACNAVRQSRHVGR